MFTTYPRAKPCQHDIRAEMRPVLTLLHARAEEGIVYITAVVFHIISFPISSQTTVI